MVSFSFWRSMALYLIVKRIGVANVRSIMTPVLRGVLTRESIWT